MLLSGLNSCLFSLVGFVITWMQCISRGSSSWVNCPGSKVAHSNGSFSINVFTCLLILKLSELHASTIVSSESLLLLVMCVHLTVDLYSLCKSAEFFSVCCAIPRALDRAFKISFFGIGVFHIYIQSQENIRGGYLSSSGANVL